MAEFYFKEHESNPRVLRNNTNFTGMSSNQNNEFKVPRIPSRYVTQTSCLSAPPQTSEPSFREVLKPIEDKLEAIDKLKFIIPIDEVKQISAEYMLRLDSLCMEKITRHVLQPSSNSTPSLLQTFSNPAPSVVRSNAGSSIMQYNAAPSIVRGTTTSSVNQSRNTKNIGRKRATSTSTIKRNTASKNARSQSVIPCSLDTDDDSTIIDSLALKKVAVVVNKLPGRKSTKTSETKTRKITTKRKEDTISPVEPKRRTVKSVLPQKDEADSTFKSPKKKNTKASQRKNNETNSLAEPKRRKNVKPVVDQDDEVQSTVSSGRKPNAKNVSKQDDDFNITKNSLRNNSTIVEIKKGKKKSVKENVDPVPEEPIACGYEQTDRELFGDVSSIIAGGSFQDSPNNMLKNVTKMSSNKNDLPAHFFSPFAKTRSVSGVSAISTPLSKTLPKNALAKRLKKPDVVAELKGVKSRPKAKRIEKNDILCLDASQESDYSVSDFSDVEEYSQEA